MSESTIPPDLPGNDRSGEHVPPTSAGPLGATPLYRVRTAVLMICEEQERRFGVV